MRAPRDGIFYLNIIIALIGLTSSFGGAKRGLE